MSESQAELAIAFADLCGSTALFERFGDVEARRVCALALDRLAEIAVGTGGRVVKTIGDEIMCAWTDVGEAIEGVSIMPRRIREDPVLVPYHLSIRVGVHAGPVLVEHGDVFGDAVNVAARMAGAAKADQILTTGDTLGKLDPAASRAVKNRFLERARVRGRHQPLEIFEILWQEGSDIELTMMPGASRDLPQTVQHGMILEHEGRSASVSADHPTISFGRSDDNDFVIRDQLVSRNHARVDFRKGRFVLSDSSTNGTGVVTDDGRQFFLHRDEATLYGSGNLILGSRRPGENAKLVRFYVDP
jgi:adenylate cyclase